MKKSITELNSFQVLTQEQQEAVLKLSAEVELVSDSSDDFSTLINSLRLELLVGLAEFLNHTYREGSPIISDNLYDSVVITRLAELDPEHPFLNNVEDEGDAIEGKTVTLPQKMLSTNKAYSRDVVESWLNRVRKAASEVGVDTNDIQLRITPKLDGFASFDDGKSMYTRGNGLRGKDIGRVIDRGMQRYRNAERALGPGEIVVSPSYFEDHLSDAFDNTRNVISSALKLKKLTPAIQKALDDGGIVFAPFESLDEQVCNTDAFLMQYDSIVKTAKDSVEFDIDGVIVEVVNPEIKTFMGASQKAHKWMIALKENEAPVEIKVLKVMPQTSRKGRIVPVLELEPTKVSGVTVSRVTAHNYSNIQSKSIGEGAVIKLVRSGLVIPMIVGMVSGVETPSIPTSCPSCGEPLSWGEEDSGNELDLMCINTEGCPAQLQNRLKHWFTTLENVDGFGPATLETLTNSGVRTIPEIYQMTAQDFIKVGFGEKTATNLVSELSRSRTEAVEDYRFLAAFGIRTLGRSMSEIILSHHAIDNVFELTANDLITIDKVGKTKAEYIVKGLSHVKEDYQLLKHELGFNLTATTTVSEQESIESPIAGKTLVFTGSMQDKSRNDMTKEAKSLGATVGKSVSSKTDFLVIGEKVGASKINAAEKHGTTVMTEREYNDLIASL